MRKPVPRRLPPRLVVAQEATPQASSEILRQKRRTLVRGAVGEAAGLAAAWAEQAHRQSPVPGVKGLYTESLTSPLVVKEANVLCPIQSAQPLRRRIVLFLKMMVCPESPVAIWAEGQMATRMPIIMSWFSWGMVAGEAQVGDRRPRRFNAVVQV